MIEEYCLDCGAVGHKRRGHRTICDGCGEPIEDFAGNVLLQVSTNDKYRTRQLQLHPRCTPRYEVTCSVCGAIADERGSVLHDAEKHGKKPEPPELPVEAAEEVVQAEPTIPSPAPYPPTFGDRWTRPICWARAIYWTVVCALIVVLLWKRFVT